MTAMTWTDRMLDLLPRPLDPVRSIKVKFGIVIVLATLAGYSYFWWKIGWIPVWTTGYAMLIALVTSQVLAHGMTRPLRDMTAAARAMAGGDYTRRARATASDEVGQLAAAFNQMADDLAATDRRRRELIANVSHELRTPVSALRAVLENIVDGVSEPDERTLRTALAQSERLGRLVTELLDLSRIDAGALPLDKETFAVAPLVAEVIAEAEVAATVSGRGTRFTVDVRPSDATVSADRERLHQVLLNLLDNAVRHSPLGGEVRVGVRVVRDQVVIEVLDEGPGIPAEDRVRVFERFTRGERPSGGGTGLGLAIAHWVVELHGGTIAVVDPDPGAGPAGGRIRITLPSP